MTPIIHRSPNMMLETLALLYIEPNYEKLFEMMPDFFGGTLRKEMYGRYIKEFRAQHQYSAERFVFTDLLIGEYVTVVFAALNSFDRFFGAATAKTVNFSEILDKSFSYACDVGVPFLNTDEFKSVKDYAASDSSSESFKELFSDADKHFSVLADSVRVNIAASETAWDCIRADVRVFTDKYWNEKYFAEHSIVAPDTALRDIYPMIAVPSSLFMLGDTCFCGVYNIDVPSENSIQEKKEFLFKCMKALSDPKRLEIIMLLKEKPRYNRELAELLGLTPATVMHHTDILIQSGLVSVTSENDNQKRVYFKIMPDRADRLKKLLEEAI